MPNYTDERNAQIVIALLKAHGIRKVVVSPGTTNICLVASMQTDPYFDLYSAADERSAAYIACGMSSESGEPIVLSCTGATASRNYYPGLTEAFYRKLPILVITSSRRNSRIGHNFDQVTDRTAVPNDIVRLSIQMPVVLDPENEWACMIAANKAILELRRHGGGPVHINLETTYSSVCNVKEIPYVRAIFRYTNRDKLPELVADRVAIFVGAHEKWSKKLTNAVDSFCQRYNAIVLCDHTSNYHGRFRVFPNLITQQKNYNSIIRSAELVIHIGNISTSEYRIKPEAVWRVNPDGEIRDTFGELKCVFEFDELEFFEAYAKMQNERRNTFIEECKDEEADIRKAIPELPFSNAWAAEQLSYQLPKGSVLHLGIRNSLRSWNFFEISDSIYAFANTGGFGIDGSLSTVLGASLINTDTIYYCVLGDLAFFYDMNVLGNRHFGNNVRILLINNGTGMELKFSTFLASTIGAEKDKYIAASGHYGNKSESLVRHYAQDLGFMYLSASNKQEFLNHIDKFVDPVIGEKSMIFELFINDTDDDMSYNLLSEIKSDRSLAAKNAIYDALGKKKVDAIKKFIKR